MTAIDYDELVVALQELDTHLEGEFWTIGNAATAIQTLRAEFERLNKAGDGDVALIYAQSLELTDTKARLAEAESVLSDLLSWFPKKPPEPEFRIPAGKYGANDAVEEARAFLAKQEPSK